MAERTIELQSQVRGVDGYKRLPRLAVAFSWSRRCCANCLPNNRHNKYLRWQPQAQQSNPSPSSSAAVGIASIGTDHPARPRP
jgi:hypothetical protein